MRNDCTMIPLATGEAQEDETILHFGFSSHTDPRFVHPDPPRTDRASVDFVCRCRQRSISLDQPLGGFHDGAFDDDARRLRISRARSSSFRASATIIVLRKRPPLRLAPLMEPTRQGRLAAGVAATARKARIIVVRSRGFPAFDTPCSCADGSALPGRRRQTGIGRDLLSIAEDSKEPLRPQNGGELRADPFERHQHSLPRGRFTALWRIEREQGVPLFLDGLDLFDQKFEPIEFTA